MRTLYDVPAPAKLNLFLHVNGRRDDGYHLLQSAFMLLDWCDTLHFEINGTGRIARTDQGNAASHALPDDDLTIRAAKLLQQHTGCTHGADITLHKHIPSEAGMGGGSSDAASCLMVLNRLWGLKLSTAELSTIGLQLGADVPFFIHGDNAWVEGIGEHITPIELPSASFLVVKPATGVPTPQIFSHKDLTKNHKKVTISDFKKSCYQFGSNDLQPVAEFINPDISHALAAIDALGLDGKMTGSGSAVFAHLPENSDKQSLETAEAWRTKLRTAATPEQRDVIDTCTVQITHNLPCHPLRDWQSG